MKRKLTNRTVQSQKPKGRNYRVADGGGLYLLVKSNGSKLWRYDCSISDRRVTLSFGEYPAVPLIDAREKHEHARALIAKGIDPRLESLNKQLEDKPFSFYAQEMLAAQQLRPTTEKKKLDKMKRHLFAPLDKKAVNQITAVDLLNLLKPIADEGKLETVKDLATYCRQTFNYLLSLQLIDNNPAATIREILPKPKKSQNFAHITKPDKFAVFLKGIDSYHGDFAVKSALQFAALAMLRPYNIRFLRWEYIDLDEMLITIPAEEMKMDRPHKIPLSKQAISILEGIKQLTGKCEYVFLTTSGQRTGNPMSENTLNQAVIRIKDPKTGKPLGRGVMTSHGFRHSTSTMLNELNFSADAIELQLAHASVDRIRATYNKAELMPERIKMMQVWADYLDGLKAGTGGIPINRKA